MSRLRVRSSSLNEVRTWTIITESPTVIEIAVRAMCTRLIKHLVEGDMHRQWLRMNSMLNQTSGQSFPVRSTTWHFISLAKTCKAVTMSQIPVLIHAMVTNESVSALGLLP